MVRRGSGLIVEMTDGDSGRYRGTLTPDFLRSEAVLEHFGVSEDNWRAGAA